MLHGKKETIDGSLLGKMCCRWVMTTAALLASGCELGGYGFIRELADGSNDTTPGQETETAFNDTEEATDDADAPDTGTVSDDGSAGHPETGGADAGMSSDSEGQTGETDTGEDCVCVCECAGEGDTAEAGDGADDDTDTDTDADTDTDTDADADGRDTGTAPEAGTDEGTEGPDSATDVGPVPGCVVLSEYVEGSARNKGVELFNCGADPVDLGAYALCLVSNDNTECGTTLPLDGVLPPGEVLTICHTSADTIPRCDLQSGVVNFSGDDRLVLLAKDAIADAFGDVDTRPEGSPWADVTLRRCNLTPYTGDSPFVAADYFTAYEKDDFTDFGVAPSEPTCAP
jgi:hypothetical protein